MKSHVRTSPKHADWWISVALVIAWGTLTLSSAILTVLDFDRFRPSGGYGYAVTDRVGIADGAWAILTGAILLGAYLIPSWNSVLFWVSRLGQRKDAGKNPTLAICGAIAVVGGLITLVRGIS